MWVWNGINVATLALGSRPKQGFAKAIVVTYEIRVFFEGAKKEVFSSIFLKTL
jgi:hypothetical protein